MIYIIISILILFIIIYINFKKENFSECKLTDLQDLDILEETSLIKSIEKAIKDKKTNKEEVKKNIKLYILLYGGNTGRQFNLLRNYVDKL